MNSEVYRKRYLKYQKKIDILEGGDKKALLEMLKKGALAAAEGAKKGAKVAAKATKKALEEAKKIKEKCHETLSEMIKEMTSDENKETYQTLFDLAVAKTKSKVEISYDLIMKHLKRLNFFLGLDKISDLVNKTDELVSIFADINCMVQNINEKKISNSAKKKMIKSLKDFLSNIVSLVQLLGSSDNSINFDCK